MTRAAIDRVRDAVEQFPSQTTVTLHKDDVRALLAAVDVARDAASSTDVSDDPSLSDEGYVGPAS